MEVGNNLASIGQAVNISMLKKSMDQNTQNMTQLIDGMKAANAKTLEKSVTPHKGGSIDVRV